MALKPTSKKSSKPAAAKSAAYSKPATAKTTKAAPMAATEPTLKAGPSTPKPAPVMAAPTRRFAEKPKDGKKEVSFNYFAPQAGSVLLAGDFTRWEASPVALQKQETGVWTATLTLPPGRYQYRLLVDGQWQNDPECRDLQPNEFGSANCICQVAT